MLKAYKYRIYLNKKQKDHLIQDMGSVRYIYNKALELIDIHYQLTGKHLGYIYLSNIFLIDQKKQNDWIKKANAQSLQSSLRNLDVAFVRFFKQISNRPKFKSKHDNRQSVQYPQGVKIDWENSKVQIPKLGKVSIVLGREFVGKIKTCTVSKTPTNKFFISILVEDDKDLPLKPEIKEETTIGIDLGIKHFATLSNGTQIDNPKYLRKNLKKLKAFQRKLSRKKKGSKNRDKARLKVAKIHEKITNQRKDFLQKTTSSIIKNSDNQTIILEDLGVANMLRNHCLALSISDCGWGMFKNMLQYKSEWYGKNLLFIGRFEPSSKMCSNCEHINKELILKDREWTCQNCQTFHDRDINAAINIKKFGLRNQLISGQSLPEEPVEIPENKIEKSCEAGSLKQEIL